MDPLQKQNDLKQLLNFCQQSNIVGWCSNIWFNGLVSRYPCAFLIYSQHDNTMQWKREQATNQIKQRIINRVDKILSMPLELNDEDLYENLINTLDDIIKLREHKIHGNFKKQ